MSLKSPSAQRVIIGATIVTMLFYVVPLFSPLAYPFTLFSTFVHEMGHGVAALLVGGEFVSFKMWSNGSGVAQITGDFGRLSRALVAAAGLIGPSIIAVFYFFGAGSSRKARAVLAVSGIVALVALLLLIRNIFGIFFVGGFSGLCFLGAFYKPEWAQSLVAFFGCELALSVFARSDYLFKSEAVTEAGIMPSDVSQIASALFLPYWFWGALCGLISLIVLGFGIKNSFK